jgi:hypothetical protein
MEGIVFSSETDISEDELADKDVTGLTAIPIEAEADAEDALPPVRERIPKPRAVDDPDWGKSNFKPSVMSAGRRAMLLDLPDPAVMAVDPLAPSREDGTAPLKIDQSTASRFEVLRRVPSPLDDPGTQAKPAQTRESTPRRNATPEEQPEEQLPKYNKSNIGSRTPKKNSKRKMRFGRKKQAENDQVESMGEWLGLSDDYDAKKDGRQIGSWDNFDDNNGKWKGGATLRAGLRDNDEYESDQVTTALPNFDSLDLMPDEGQDIPEQPIEKQEVETYEEELGDDVLHFGDDDIIAHDIWFVGVGASARDHAGVKAFLDEHRRDIRGAFLINLDSVGAGNLTLLTSEGTGAKRRSDRRLGRMLTNIADALHIDLGRADYSWDETDATPAMQRSVRVSTLMGMSSDGVAAHSHTSDDEPEYLNDKQIASVADIVAELIRRS